MVGGVALKNPQVFSKNLFHNMLNFYYQHGVLVSLPGKVGT